MGRGRAKAKQTKVARQLKYNSQKTDFASLQRELSGSSHTSQRVLSEERDPDDATARWEEDEHDWRR